MKFQNSSPSQVFLTQLEKRPVLVWALSVLWILLISGIVFWWRLGSTGLVDETEPLFAEAARQMTVTSDWITPYFDGKTRFDKPPLVYWIMAIAYRTIGVNEWAVRFPSALAATVLTGFGFYVLRYFGFPRPAAHANLEIGAEESAAQAISKNQEPLSAPSKRFDRQFWLSAGIGSALIALNLETLVWARTGVSDLLLSGCMGASLLAFFMGYAQPTNPSVQNRWYLAFYVLSALAVLTKGPVGVVLPVLIIGAFLLYMGNFRTVLREMRLVRGSLLFLAIALPWYILVIWANGEDFIDSFFGYHNFERFTRVVNNHWAPWYFYFLVVPIAFLPWSIHLPVAIARLRFWQPQRWRQQPRSTHLGLFALIWFAVIFAFFTLAVTKLPSYMIPLLPAAAILVGLFWSDQMTRQQSSRGVWISHVVHIAFLILLAVGLFFSPHWLGKEPEMPNFPQLLRQSGIVLWGGGIVLGAAIVSLVLLLQRQGRWLWLVNLVGFLAFILLVIVPTLTLIDVQRQLPLRQLAATIVQVQKPGEPLLMVGLEKPTIVFYAQRPVTFVSAPSFLPERLQKLAPKLAKPTAPSHSLLILGRLPKLEEAGLQPDRYRTIAEAGVYRLIRLEFPPGQAPVIPKPPES